MRKFLIPFALITILFSGCTQNQPLAFSGDDILERVYSDYKFPEGFYTEETDSGSFYYENTISIKAPDEREAVWIELSTNSVDTARQWSELSARHSAYYRTLVGERETEKFFEFRRMRETNPADVLLSRVHKRSYLDRSMYDSFKKGPVIGRYTARPMRLPEVKELIEYLVFIREYKNGSYKVLDSQCKEEKTYFLHTLTEALVVYGDWGLRDQITLRISRYVIDKYSGEIRVRREVIRTIEGRMNSGGIY